jgi:hypothetical protein
VAYNSEIGSDSFQKSSRQKGLGSIAVLPNRLLQATSHTREFPPDAQDRQDGLSGRALAFQGGPIMPHTRSSCRDPDYRGLSEEFPSKNEIRERGELRGTQALFKASSQWKRNFRVRT